jgi:hypothetical protein
MLPHLSRSALAYRERSGLCRTLRGPYPAAAPRENPAHSFPVAPPLPAPELLRAAGGQPPDSGPAQIWPFGGDGTVAP